MREILFRAKSIDNDKWVYGSFVMDATELVQRERQNQNFVLADGFVRRYNLVNHKVEMHEVDRNTVGQYIGLTDKNGKKIFEGDIVLYERDEEYGQIAYHENEAMFVVQFDTWLTNFDHMYGKDLEVIGNIHDNPELLKGSEQE